MKRTEIIKLLTVKEAVFVRHGSSHNIYICSLRMEIQNQSPGIMKLKNFWQGE